MKNEGFGEGRPDGRTRVRAERSRALGPFPVSTRTGRVRRLVIQDDIMENGLRFSCAAQILHNPVI